MCCTTRRTAPCFLPSWVTNAWPDDDLGLLAARRGTAAAAAARRARRPAARVTKSVSLPRTGCQQGVAQPPGDDEQDGDDAAGDVDGEHPEQREDRQRDAVAVPQRRHDQHHRGHRDAVGGQVGHRGGVELDVGDRGEGRRQGRGGRRRAGGAPLVGLAGAAAARSGPRR